MKLSYIYNIALAVLPILGMSSCKDFLDTEPDERVTVDTEDKVVQLLTTAYNTGNYGWLCEVSSDNIIDNNAPHLPASTSSAQKTNYYNLSYYDRGDEEAFKFEPVKSSTSSDSPSSIWSGCYGAIATANHALMYIDQIVENGGQMTDKLKAAKAEALLIRAYHHFLLVNIFSQAYKNDELSKKDKGIPYTTVPETQVAVHYERGTVTDVYNKIQEDLEAGLKDISDINYTKPKWHFNVNAAHAFAARFYLYKRDYDKVIEHANYVLGTDSATTASMLMDYSGFSGCTYGSDYANVWKDPEAKNNIMLCATYSGVWRRYVGRRFNCNGLALRHIFYRTGPTWGWTIIPCAMVSGATFYDGDADHGFTWSKICEQFEYTDKVAGIGYAHQIRREFTANELLLARAEAYLLGSSHDKAKCFQDLALYEQSRQNLSEEDKSYYGANNGMRPLTEDMITTSWYCYSETKNIRYLNCYEDWNFTQNMSPDFIVPADCVPYMNCINDYRRFETSYEGLRFFDLKRYGIEYSHFVGYENTEYHLTWDDPRRALEVPQEVIAAGLEPSQSLPTNESRTGGATLQKYVGYEE